MYAKEKAPMAATKQGENRQAEANQTYNNYYTPHVTKDASLWRCCIHCGDMIPGTDYYYDTSKGPLCTGCVSVLQDYEEVTDEAV